MASPLDRRGFLAKASASIGVALALPSLVRATSLQHDALHLFVSTLEEDVIESPGPQLTLYEFVQQAWDIVEPDHAFVPNWHIEAICEHLQGVTAGYIKNLAINIPPGCMKSKLVSVLWPAWEWTRQPTLRYLCVSYDQALSTRDNLAVRELVESPWYQDRWPSVTLKRDQNQKTRFDTTKHGWRLGTSIGGRATGEHPHRKIIDDPLNAEQAESDADRTRANRFISRTLPTRGRALGAATVLIMQRLHEEDPTGQILAAQDAVQLATTRSGREIKQIAEAQRINADWATTHPHDDAWAIVCLPMRLELDRRCTTYGSCTATHHTDQAGVEHLVYGPPRIWTDPRASEGQLLWPAMFDDASVKTLEDTLLEYGTAGQLQQRPAPEAGGLFKREYLAIIDALPAADQIAARARGWDGAANEDGKGDPTASVRACITYGGIVYIEDVTVDHVGPGDDETLMKQIAALDLTECGPGVMHREEQEPGSAGKKVIASHAKVLVGHDYVGTPSTGSKTSRARPLAAQAKVGNVKLLRRPWNKKFLDELCMFPNAKHDDQVDAAANAFAAIALEAQSSITFGRTSSGR